MRFVVSLLLASSCFAVLLVLQLRERLEREFARPKNPPVVMILQPTMEEPPPEQDGGTPDDATPAIDRLPAPEAVTAPAEGPERWPDPTESPAPTFAARPTQPPQPPEPREPPRPADSAAAADAAPPPTIAADEPAATTESAARAEPEPAVPEPAESLKDNDAERSASVAADADPPPPSVDFVARAAGYTLPDMPDDLRQLPDLDIRTSPSVDDWRRIDEAFGIVTVAYTIDSREPAIYLIWDRHGRIRRTNELDRRGYSNRCRHRSEIDRFRTRLMAAKRRMGILRPMRIIGLVPADVDRGFAAAQLDAVRRANLPPDQVATTVARYDVSGAAPYGLIIDEVIRTRR